MFRRPGWGPGDPAALPGSLAQLTFRPRRFCGSHYPGGWRRGRTPIGRQMDQQAARRCPGQAGPRLPVNTAPDVPRGEVGRPVHSAPAEVSAHPQGPPPTGAKRPPLLLPSLQMAREKSANGGY